MADWARRSALATDDVNAGKQYDCSQKIYTHALKFTVIFQVNLRVCILYINAVTCVGACISVCSIHEARGFIIMCVSVCVSVLSIHVFMRVYYRVCVKVSVCVRVCVCVSITVSVSVWSVQEHSLSCLR